eukprot:2645876-Pleurochrysis_carterae.AAC.4
MQLRSLPWSCFPSSSLQHERQCGFRQDPCGSNSAISCADHSVADFEATCRASQLVCTIARTVSMLDYGLNQNTVMKGRRPPPRARDFDYYDNSSSQWALPSSLLHNEY